MHKRAFLKAIFGMGAVAAVPVSAAAEAVIATTAPPQNEIPVIHWPCMQCQAQNSTVELIWQTMKFRLQCTTCGRRQSYILWLKKFDPHPTDFTQQFEHSVLRDLTPTSELTRERQARYVPPTLKERIRARLKRGYRVLPIPE